ncbi:hypothetical protein HHL25_14190 [Rhizobium sp. S-51]|uniref:Uncharacterized protein n=1 Tax=Rhizobium terricola TaxID=2728849 RepID=A0A7Y0AXG6_9HYPH|nr:hypothetical protein [Rhizobium terricola]NML75277.1 hypothetical protein [Rhizobium terricola]
MSNTVRIDRHAFRKGVEDLMTLAPLRAAVSGAFVTEKRSDKTTVVSQSKRESATTAHHGRNSTAEKNR